MVVIEVEVEVVEVWRPSHNAIDPPRFSCRAVTLTLWTLYACTSQLLYMVAGVV